MRSEDMSRRNSSGGLTTLLGLVAVGLIIAGIVYSIQDNDKEKAKKTEKPEEVKIQPRNSNADSIAESLGLGDGTLKSAKKAKASGLGEATAISGGGIKTGSGSSRKSSTSGSSKRSSRKTTRRKKKG